MRFLLEPANNTLSHLAKALAVREALLRRGHEVVLAAAGGRSPFLRGLDVPHEVLPDVQEADGGDAPAFCWFRPGRFEACVRAELALLARARPDRVLGIFRFTGAVSAALAGVPYDALVCGCMTPACEETLGFAPGEPGERAQADALAFFRRASAARIHPALARLGAPAADDAWALLLGERTFLWDLPSFQPIAPRPGLRHVGPIAWEGWPFDPGAAARLEALADPVALVSFGTGRARRAAAERAVALLGRLGFSVALAGGGQGAAGWPPPGPRFAAFDFLPVEAALHRAAAVVCHGGQGIALEALRRGVPVLALPFQPEQSQNGRCLERLGTGLRLARGEGFFPGAATAEEAFLAASPGALERRVEAFLSAPALRARCAAAAAGLAGVNGLAALVEGLERGP